MSDLSFPEKVLQVATGLASAGLPYALGGALALAHCVPSPRATADIDINVFVTDAHLDAVLNALPDGVVATRRDVSLLRRDAQARLWWGDTPVDVFLTNVTFHTEAATRVTTASFGEHRLQFLSCRDLAVFKCFFDRDKDWVDLGEMLRRGSVDVDWVLGTMVRHLGGGDQRVEKLRSLAARVAAEEPQEWRG